MSLASQIAAVVAAIGADVKSVYSRIAALEVAVPDATHRWLRCTKVTDFWTNATTPVNVPEMGVTLEPNTAYSFEYNVVYRSTASSVGVALAVTGPTGYEVLAYRKITPTTTTAAVISSANVYGADQPTATSPASNQDYFATIDGVIVTGANGGLFTLQAASETTSSITIRVGSIGIIERS